MCEEPKAKVSRWRLWRKAVIGALGGVGIYLAAILAHQPDVSLSDGPMIQAVGLSEYRLAQDYRTAFTVAGKRYGIEIKAGFVYDGASIPAALRYPLGLDPLSGCLMRGALVHDALYGSELLPRDVADTALLVIAQEDGTEGRKARAIYRAVHDAGAIVWSRHTPESVEQARAMVTVAERVAL
jgi:hypothetical protein